MARATSGREADFESVDAALVAAHTLLTAKRRPSTHSKWPPAEAQSLETARETLARLREPSARRRLEDERASRTRKLAIQTPEGRIVCYANVGVYPDGLPGELFLTVDKRGSLLSGFANALAQSVSIGLQYGVPLSAFTRKFKGMMFEPRGRTNLDSHPFAKSLLDLLAVWLDETFKEDEPK